MCSFCFCPSHQCTVTRHVPRQVSINSPQPIPGRTLRMGQSSKKCREAVNVDVGKICQYIYIYTLCIYTLTLQAPGLSHITRRKVTSPNGIARWRKVTSHGGKSHHFATIPMAQRHSTENRKVTKSSRDIAHSEIFVDFRKKFASNTNGTACAI